jgi:general secretion pathway protein I
LPPADASRTRAADGFTLLEVLVAFVIAALALGVLFEGAAVGLRSARSAGAYEQAVARARSHLAVIGHGQAVAPGVASGDDGSGFQWSTRVTQVAAGRKAPPPESPAAPAVSYALYDVAVSIGWVEDGRPRSVTLQTRRVGTARQPSS